MKITKNYPTADEIKAKKNEFLEKVKKSKKPNQNEELKTFLLAIKPQIKQATQNGASNPKIIKTIKEVYGVSVTLARLADFCAEHNIATNTRTRKTKKENL